MHRCVRWCHLSHRVPPSPALVAGVWQRNMRQAAGGITTGCATALVGAAGDQSSRPPRAG